MRPDEPCAKVHVDVAFKAKWSEQQTDILLVMRLMLGGGCCFVAVCTSLRLHLPHNLKRVARKGLSQLGDDAARYGKTLHRNAT